jgi:hypothetical protein
MAIAIKHFCADQVLNQQAGIPAAGLPFGYPRCAVAFGLGPLSVIGAGARPEMPASHMVARVWRITRAPSSEVTDLASGRASHSHQSFRPCDRGNGLAHEPLQSTECRNLRRPAPGAGSWRLSWPPSPSG